MGELRLHAISVYEVRDMFGALPDLAAELRTIASNAFVVPMSEHQAKQSLIDRIGPMRRRDPLALFHPPEQPTARDWESLIEGRHIEPTRLVAAWRVVDAWIEARDWGTATFTMSPQEVERFDFSLTKAGLPAQYGLRNLLTHDAALPLRPAHGMRVGYSKNPHVLATAEQLRLILDRVEEGPHGPARYLWSFLDAFTGWTNQARQQDRLPPDLFVAWWQTSRGEPPASDVQTDASARPVEPIVTGSQARRGAEHDPTAPFQTGRQPRRPDVVRDPTQPMVTGRQGRQPPPR